MKIHRNFLALILTFCMILSLIPANVRATELSGGEIEKGTFQSAGEFISGNLKYVRSSAGEACVTGYVNPVTDLVIPSEVDGLKVTGIDDNAFGECKTITSVTIPNTVKKIGATAFTRNSLTSVTIPASVTYIGYSAFYGNENLYSINVLGDPEYDGNPFGGTAWNAAQGNYPIMKSVLLDYNGEVPASITIPSNVKKINLAAFMYAHSLESVVLPTGLTEIGNSAFYGCENLTSINFPSTLKKIDGYALCYTKLSNVNIPAGITEIADGIFAYVRTLKNIQIPDSVTRIGHRSFEGCSGLTTITLPKNLTEIGPVAFNESGLISVEIPDSVKKIDVHAFRYCENLKSVTLGSGLTSIGNYAFFDCYNLKTINVPENVNKIGSYCFGFHEPFGDWQYYNVPGFTMTGVDGSTAHNYAITNKIPFNGVLANIDPFAPPTISIGNTGNGISITWNPVMKATKYVIERRVTLSDTFKKVTETDSLTTFYENVIPTSEMNSSYVRPGRYITYRVQAYNGSTPSGYSEEMSIYYMVKPEIISLENVSNGVKLSWKEESGAAQMEIYRKTADGDYSKIATVDGYNITSYTDTTAEPEKTYTYKIRGAVFDQEDNKTYTSIYSDEKSIVTPKPVKVEPHVNHVWDSGKITTSPTCGANGVKTYTCTSVGCGATKTEPVPATGKHSWDGGKVTTPATTTSTGVKTYTCTVCKTATKTETIDKLPGTTDPGTPTPGTPGTPNPGTPDPGTPGTPTPTPTPVPTPVPVDNVIKASNFTKTYATKAQSFSIGAQVNGGAALTYTSNNKYVTVNSAGKVTVKAKFIGAATITIKSAATTDYKAAEKKITVTVNPTKTAIAKAANIKGKKLQVKWRRNAVGTGYQVQYSTNSKFAKGNKTVTIKSNKTVATTISRLVKGKTYYVRMRTYKTVSKKNYYSGWSTVKRVKITK